MIPNIFKERSAFEMLKSEFQIDTTWHRRRPEFLFERIWSHEECDKVICLYWLNML
jgi:hypothetical protein